MSANRQQRPATTALRAVLSLLALAAGLALLGYSIATVVRGPAVRPTPTPRPRPTITLDPAEGYAGTYVTVTGVNWPPGETVYIYLSPPFVEEEAYAYDGAEVGADGAFIAAIVFPDDPSLLDRGAVGVVARTKSRLQASAPFRLRRPTPVAPTATPTPMPTPSVQPTLAPTATYTPVPPTATPVPTPQLPTTFAGWKGEYYDNPTLSGEPTLVRDDATIDFRWTTGSPDPAIPADDFSVRWTRTLSLAAGTYHFRVRSDDGCRLWVDGKLLVDEWHDSAETLYSASVFLDQGPHSVVLEYYERAGSATVGLWWEYEDAFPNWKGEYFANANLAGPPALVRDDEQVDFAWGLAAPAPEIPADGFSVRWTRKWYFLPGNYRFYARAWDGVRVWFDDTLVIDEWHTGSETTYAGDVRVTDTGWHTVRIAYYNASGKAEVKVSWEALVSYAGWKGEYFSNRDLRGQPVFVRDDPTLNFEWGLGSPGPGIGSDNFSVRWTREMEFAAGTYEFTVVVDDGVRVWVDDWKVLDQWQDGIRRTYTAVFEGLSAGRHTIRVEYYEHMGEAVLRFWWTKQTAVQRNQGR
ncbi:MAG: hypothetical protein Kow00123_24130 [Anaerolineales bacterium]